MVVDLAMLFAHLPSIRQERDQPRCIYVVDLDLAYAPALQSAHSSALDLDCSTCMHYATLDLVGTRIPRTARIGSLSRIYAIAYHGKYSSDVGAGSYYDSTSRTY